MGDNAEVQFWLDRHRGGDLAARDRLLVSASVQLNRLARKMLHDNPRIRRWEDTDDLFQNAAIRLCRSLDELRPETPRDFFRLAASHLRRELIDLARHHFGPEGAAGHHASQNPHDAPIDASAGSGDAPDRLAAWAEFHGAVEQLPEEERDAFDLLWYQSLPQSEASAVLGVSERTLKRRWQTARLKLAHLVPPSNGTGAA